MTIDDILEGFALLDDWEDRYRFLIELGRDLPPFPDEARNPRNKVEGCASQVWLIASVAPGTDGPVVTFQADSDAHLVRGLLAILLALYSGRSAADILAVDASKVLDGIGLREHLTPQRSNGLRAVVGRIRATAEHATAPV